MANRTYLIQSTSAVPRDLSPENDILAASKYSIPVFWYALFDKSSIVPKSAKMEDGTSTSYPFLTTSTAAAKGRFAARRGILQTLLSQSVVGLQDDFTRLLDTVETSHIHLETVELWMMDEPGQFLPHIEACLRAFELANDGVANVALKNTAEWRALLGQVNLDVDDISGSLKYYMLTGSSWGRPVTWRE